MLLEIAGVPMLVRVLDVAAEAGFTLKPIVVVNPRNHEAIKNVLGDRAVYAVQEEQLGTGHAVQVAHPLIDSKAVQVMVLYGDHPLINPATLRSVGLAHDVHDKPLSMVTFHTFPGDELDATFQDFGRVMRDEHGEVLGVVEKKDATSDQLAITEKNPSYFVMDTDWLTETLFTLGNENVQGEYYLTDMVAKAVESGRGVYAHIIDNPAEGLGVNTQEQFAFAEKLLS